MGFAAMEAITLHPENRVHWLNRPVALTNCIGITGPISRTNDFEDTGGPFFLDPEGRQADIIRDDVAMWLHTPAGLVICVGCCHSGLVNTLDYITARTGEKRIAMIIGGLHLLHSSPERLAKTVAALGGFSIGRIVACHCSGEEAVRYLQQHLAVEVVWGQAGMVIDI
jgi:7,8-dihydropterin-6-yl-methyl-4-(beta-D-ribofuranosyl)aminobenzene 5'-phosphate synthase